MNSMIFSLFCGIGCFLGQLLVIRRRQKKYLSFIKEAQQNNCATKGILLKEILFPKPTLDQKLVNAWFVYIVDDTEYRIPAGRKVFHPRPTILYSKNDPQNAYTREELRTLCSYQRNTLQSLCYSLALSIVIYILLNLCGVA